MLYFFPSLASPLLGPASSSRTSLFLFSVLRLHKMSHGPDLI